MNGVLWHTAWGQPKEITENVDFLNNAYHKLLVKTCDDVGNCSEKNLDFNWATKNNPVSGSKNNIRLDQPADEIELSSNQGSINFSFAIMHSNRSAKLNLNYEKDGKITTIRSVDHVNPQTIITLSGGLPPGEYAFFGELFDWNGDVLKSQAVSIKIK